MIVEGHARCFPSATADEPLKASSIHKPFDTYKSRRYLHQQPSHPSEALQNRPHESSWHLCRVGSMSDALRVLCDGPPQHLECKSSKEDMTNMPPCVLLSNIYSRNHSPCITVASEVDLVSSSTWSNQIRPSCRSARWRAVPDVRASVTQTKCIRSRWLSRGKSEVHIDRGAPAEVQSLKRLVMVCCRVIAS